MDPSSGVPLHDEGTRVVTNMMLGPNTAAPMKAHTKGRHFPCKSLLGAGEWNVMRSAEIVLLSSQHAAAIEKVPSIWGCWMQFLTYKYIMSERDSL